LPVDPNVLVGHAGSDDAGVYKISDDMALVLTVDFFTPIVDDPFDFGRIAATNALSDVYAMGGKPIVAMNVAGFPEKDIPADILNDILRGGSHVAGEAGVTIVGGHTVDDKELKYGMAVVGFIHPDAIVTNAGAKPGDVLVLTKPLGTGVMATAVKRGKLDEAGIKRLVGVMTTLNRTAATAMLAHNVHSATDVTGFGLAGHANHMARESHVTITIDSKAMPLIEGAREAVIDGQLTGGAKKNKKHLEDMMQIGPDVDEVSEHIVFDPQTAGGLLIALTEADASALLDEINAELPQATIVGRCSEPSDVNVGVR
jgi:selenide,water dikinase